MDDAKKGAKPITVADLPAGLRDIAELPAAEEHKLIGAAGAGKPPAPAATPNQPKEQQRQERPRTQKEQELEVLIEKRQGVIEQLKAKNPSVAECRKRIAEAIPALQGTGATHTMRLVKEAEHLEFLIATEADTPKKEKELIKRLRAINAELSKHKELDDARKKVDAERSVLRSLLSEVKSLEHELMQARKACDEKYSEVLAERKGAYEQRQHRREERNERAFQGLRQRVREEKRHEDDSEMEKYMKDYDDTVSMDEICVFEKKEKKKEGAGSAEESAGQKEE